MVVGLASRIVFVRLNWVASFVQHYGNRRKNWQDVAKTLKPSTGEFKVMTDFHIVMSVIRVTIDYLTVF